MDVAEDLLDALADALADGVAGVARGAPVNGGFGQFDTGVARGPALLYAAEEAWGQSMTDDDRIRELKEALEQERARRDWLASGVWGESKAIDVKIGDGVDAGIDHHGHVIATYEFLIETLEARRNA